MNNIISIISTALIGGVMATADVTLRDWQLYSVLGVNAFMLIFNGESNKTFIGNAIAMTVMLTILNTAGINYHDWQYWIILVIVFVTSLVSYVINHS